MEYDPNDPCYALACLELIEDFQLIILSNFELCFRLEFRKGLSCLAKFVNQHIARHSP